MSRDFLDKELETKKKESGRYQAGDGSLLISGKAKKLADFYLRADAWKNFPARDGISQTATEMVHKAVEAKGFDAQLYLDEVIHAIAKDADPGQAAAVDMVLSPLVQTLYDHGHNGLRMDMRDLATPLEGTDQAGRSRKGQQVATSLQGREQDPLKLEVQLETEEQFGGAIVGGGASNCAITVFGYAMSVGSDSTNSTFHIERLRTTPSQRDLGCTYFIDNIDAVEAVPRLTRKIYGEETVALCTEGKRFFLQGWALNGGNRFYVPTSATLQGGLKKYTARFRARFEDSEHDGWQEVILR